MLGTIWWWIGVIAEPQERPPPREGRDSQLLRTAGHVISGNIRQHVTAVHMWRYSRNSWRYFITTCVLMWQYSPTSSRILLLLMWRYSPTSSRIWLLIFLCGDIRQLLGELGYIYSYVAIFSEAYSYVAIFTN